MNLRWWISHTHTDIHFWLGGTYRVDCRPMTQQCPSSFTAFSAISIASLTRCTMNQRTDQKIPFTLYRTNRWNVCGWACFQYRKMINTPSMSSPYGSWTCDGASVVQQKLCLHNHCPRPQSQSPCKGHGGKECLHLEWHLILYYLRLLESSCSFACLCWVSDSDLPAGNADQSIAQ